MSLIRVWRLLRSASMSTRASEGVGATGCVAATALACIFIGVSPAHAQDIDVQVVGFTGRTEDRFTLMALSSTTAAPINQGECDAGAEIEFRFNNVDVRQSNLFIFQGADCDDVDVRNEMTNTRCQLVAGPFATDNRTQVSLTLDVSQLVPCGEGGGAVLHLWVLALNTTSDLVTGPGQVARFNLAYDFEGPPGPSEFRVRGGETAASLSWEGLTANLLRYEVYMDPEGCTDGMVDSAALGDPNDPDPATLVATVEGTASSVRAPFPDSVPIGGEAAVAIRAIDLAGNPGALSAVRCVSRFEVMTWLEAYCSGGDASADVCAGEGCSTSPGSAERPAWLSVGLLGLLGALAARRRRRR